MPFFIKDFLTDIIPKKFTAKNFYHSVKATDKQTYERKLSFLF